MSSKGLQALATAMAISASVDGPYSYQGFGDIENEIYLAYEDYCDDYGIDEAPVTESELEEMAYLLRKKLDADADVVWTHARCQAVNEVLRKRERRDEE